jgi:hypothetical protein
MLVRFYRVTSCRKLLSQEASPSVASRKNICCLRWTAVNGSK